MAVVCSQHNSWVHEFAQYLREKGLRENTINTYIVNCKEFVNWLQIKDDMMVVYEFQIKEYRDKLKDLKYKASTINTKLQAIENLIKYLMQVNEKQRMVVDKSDYMRVQKIKYNPNALTVEHVEDFRMKLLHSSTSTNFRDFAFATLLAYSGVRISEAIDMKIEDINFPAGEIIIRDGKGNKERLVLIGDKVVRALREYIRRYRKNYDDAGYLFTSTRNIKLHRATINNIFKKYSASITPHSLRHFFCTRALENGWGIHEVAQQAGHESIQTTMIYLNADRIKMREKINNI